MKNFLLLIFYVLLFFTISINAQTDKIGVSVSVSAEDSIKSNIESYIKRELRALGDIDLYPTKPEYDIRIVALKPNNAIAISVVVIEKYDFTLYINNSLVSKNIDDKTKKDLIETLAKQETVEQHFLFSDAAYNLNELCKSVVATIDTDTFEKKRELLRIFERYKSKTNSSNTQSDKTYQTPVSKSSEGNQPVFERRYVGGNKPPEISVKNLADETLTLDFGNAKFTILPGKTQIINTTDGGLFSFTASAPGIKSLTGQKNFERGYVYTWTFYVVTVRK